MTASTDVGATVRPPVSVCMATFNGQRFITKQLRSILCQLNDCDEVIISDDGSTDETLAIIRGLGDFRIKVLERLGPRKSPIDNFGNALAYASHSLVFLADQDDLWEVPKVETVSRLLQLYDLVVTDCSLIDEDGATIAPSFFEQHGSKSGFWSNLTRNSYLGCCMAFRRSLLEKALPLPPKVPMHDIWLGMLAELYGTTYFHPEPLVAYRRHATNATMTGGRSPNMLWQKIGFRYNLLSCLIQRIVERRLAEP
ncbi:MAG: glycosyltransferase family 2 protein [Geobacter sp.]|nr:glycosyltransferase family 2 protein [Geobacter sp.]